MKEKLVQKIERLKELVADLQEKLNVVNASIVILKATGDAYDIFHYGNLMESYEDQAEHLMEQIEDASRGKEAAEERLRVAIHNHKMIFKGLLTEKQIEDQVRACV
jgi:ribosome maturation protein Sdo1